MLRLRDLELQSQASGDLQKSSSDSGNGSEGLQPKTHEDVTELRHEMNPAVHGLEQWLLFAFILPEAFGKITNSKTLSIAIPIKLHGHYGIERAHDFMCECV